VNSAIRKHNDGSIKSQLRTA